MESRQVESKQTQAGALAMSLEVLVLPVADVDRAKRFYGDLGWRLDADFAVSPEFRVVQLTPPGSKCSVHFGKGVTPAAPGSLRGAILVVPDLVATREELLRRGIEVSDPFHFDATFQRRPGMDPERRTYASRATFRDPDGNEWVLQEITTRLPGRE
jgi:catechol 2,3-dioxygenase-like lactoylglutathione lyase family enzyme